MHHQKTAAFRHAPPHLLAAAYTLTCLVYAWRFNRYSSKTFSFLWEENGISEAGAGRVETAMILLLLFSAGCIWSGKLRNLSLLGIIPMFFEMLSETFMPSAKYPLLYWAEWALRYTVPAAAIILLNPSERNRAWSMGLLRISIALTFAAHGIKALLSDPHFLDFLLVFLRRINVQTVNEEWMLHAVHLIGIFDLCLAAHLLFFKLERNRAVLIWMATWGAITALARITYGGWGNWHEVCIRSAHSIGPITLLLLISIRRSETSD
ncbi:hypothetical protein [Pontiella agarivorans]|uniref:Uncharacterized protein n=1 Tax=Pontiella agarivorans TaxID=3038953 RepID=A0ABU5N1G7_9BACT|nr:hypothetical protein [Pontiella agarivorans]MDZ8120267.1 hypothetical protein [Pontiella agarivorans]